MRILSRSKRSGFHGLALCCIMLFSVSSASGEVLRTCEYMPLVTGNTWGFVMGDGEMTMEVTDIVSENGYTAWQLTWRYYSFGWEYLTQNSYIVHVGDWFYMTPNRANLDSLPQISGEMIGWLPEYFTVGEPFFSPYFEHTLTPEVWNRDGGGTPLDVLFNAQEHGGNTFFVLRRDIGWIYKYGYFPTLVEIIVGVGCFGNGSVPPSNPGATDITTNSITWTWQDNSVDETGFKVFTEPGAGPPTTLRMTTPANAVQWVYAGLVANTLYAFQVAATDVYGGDTSLTPNYTAWTLAATPVAPIVDNATVHTLSVVIGTGDANPAYTVYAIQISPAVGGNTWVQADGTVGASAVYQTAAVWGMIAVTGFQGATEYAFSVIARNGAGVDTEPGPAGHGTTLAVPVITQQPVGGSAYIGDSFAFTVAASGGLPPLNYQWRLGGGNIDGATNTDLTLGLLSLDDAGGYDCVITDSGVDSVTSNLATLGIADHLTITSQPRGENLLLGAPYTLFVENDGGYLPLTYRWIKDETDITLATKSSYEITSFGVADAGSYTVKISDIRTEVAISNPAELRLRSEVPVAGVAGLAATVVAVGLLGALRLRRGNKHVYKGG